MQAKENYHHSLFVCISFCTFVASRVITLWQSYEELRNTNGCYFVTQFSSNTTNRFILSELSFLAKVIKNIHEKTMLSIRSHLAIRLDLSVMICLSGKPRWMPDWDMNMFLLIIMRMAWNKRASARNIIIYFPASHFHSLSGKHSSRWDIRHAYSVPVILCYVAMCNMPTDIHTNGEIRCYSLKYLMICPFRADTSLFNCLLFIPIPRML